MYLADGSYSISTIIFVKQFGHTVAKYYSAKLCRRMLFCDVNIYVLLTAARAIPSYTRSNSAAMRECIEYDIAQIHSQ